MSQLFKDQIVWITGASAGIGKASAHAFAKEGAKLLLISRRRERLDELSRELKTAFKSDVLVVPCDAADFNRVSESLNQLPEHWKTPDILLNNAGLAKGVEKVWEISPENWNAVIDTNIKGILNFCHFAIPRMLKKNKGLIINMGSVAAHDSYPGGGVYSASKHAVKALTDALRMELVASPIRVSMISPGMVETEFSLVRFEGDAKRAASIYEHIEALTAEDIAETILFIASRPPHVNIADLIIYPTHQASVFVVHKEKNPKDGA